jgi:trehalose 6-phosphate phosphatase
MQRATSSIAPSPAPSCLPDHSAFFFDVDGTLFELMPRPQDVIADESLRRLLRDVAARAGGAVALVSGRSLADLDRIFAPLVLPAAGLHGSEIRASDGSVLAAQARIMDHARAAVSHFVAGHPGLFLEDKGATLAVHFRQRPDLGPAVLQFLTTFTPGDEIAVQEGKLVVELKSALFDKGTAIAGLLEQAPFAGRAPVFFGDDLTDEAGFVYVNRTGGTSVRIGSSATPTEARFHLPDAAALRAWLTALLQQRRG